MNVERIMHVPMRNKTTKKKKRKKVTMLQLLVNVQNVAWGSMCPRKNRDPRTKKRLNIINSYALMVKTFLFYFSFDISLSLFYPLLSSPLQAESKRKQSISQPTKEGHKAVKGQDSMQREIYTKRRLLWEQIHKMINRVRGPQGNDEKV